MNLGRCLRVITWLVALQVALSIISVGLLAYAAMTGQPVLGVQLYRTVLT